MRNIWVTSDTHFNHEKILTFRDDTTRSLIRQFSSVEEMNETMIENWNKVVKPGDKVYHLGDVFFGSKDSFSEIWKRLNGSKRLIVGNHDDVPFLSSGGYFKKVSMWRVFAEHNVILSHVPLHYESLFRSKDVEIPMVNIHGHIHQNKSPNGPYINACVEVNNYTPVNLEEIAEVAKNIRASISSTV
jgi:calcineurin-like phosphoesterase family protein